jgi:hypothetical protein
VTKGQLGQIFRDLCCRKSRIPLSPSAQLTPIKAPTRVEPVGYCEHLQSVDFSIGKHARACGMHRREQEMVETRMTHYGSNPLPGEPQSGAIRTGRVGPVGKRLLLLMVGCIVGMVLYAVFHDPNVQHVSHVPGPGAAPLPDSPALTPTSPRVPPPGDRATGTVIGPDVKTAPPPLWPARPVTE